MAVTQNSAIIETLREQNKETQQVKKCHKLWFCSQHYVIILITIKTMSTNKCKTAQRHALDKARKLDERQEYKKITMAEWWDV